MLPRTLFDVCEPFLHQRVDLSVVMSGRVFQTSPTGSLDDFRAQRF
jgi:hypothetical protein